MSWTAWEKRADEPANAIEHLVIPDPQGGEASGDLEGPWPRHRGCPCSLVVGAIKNAGPREVSRTAWEERADEPANAVDHCVIADPEGGKVLRGVKGPWPGHRRCPRCSAVGVMKNAGPREVSRTAWEERAEEPVGAVKCLFVADTEENETLGGLEEAWPRHWRWPCCATAPARRKIEIAGSVL